MTTDTDGIVAAGSADTVWVARLIADAFHPLAAPSGWSPTRGGAGR